MKVESLKLSNLLKNTLTRVGISELGDLAKWEYTDGQPCAPSAFLIRLCREKDPKRKDGAPSTGYNIGPSKWKELFDAALLAALDAEKQKTDEVNKDALLLVQAMIHRSSGDIGGRDQTKLFSEIAYDFLSALRAEEMKRSGK